MHCPFCGSTKNIVSSTNKSNDPEMNADKRWRQCLNCDETFKTIETVGDINVKTAKYKTKVTAQSELFQSKVSLQLVGGIRRKTLCRTVEHEEPAIADDRVGH